ncbi:deoxyribonuclease V [Thiohalobacter thiocyanaticus]|uniref:Endonuclease V n=1 Tax=Thiohalobacter thiocyanaticus TaxID=585455 RepID=A0A426QKM4_9GAMM|nr:deoxyribonuclease V [Thiohalobacter thiocyanaticus]RRQ22266.1 deoxyribonuclease V [Thiohalobacter thiocyanaticus]
MTPTPSPVHPWAVSPALARQIQSELAHEVIREDRLDPVRRVAGADIGFEAGGRVTRAAVVVLDYPGLDVCERLLLRRPTRFPYIPGLLSFREVPALLEALDGLHTPPDLILCDGQGLAHPRRFGLACHLGVLSGIPTIGVAKSRLIGRHIEPGPARGDWAPLYDGDEIIGAALRTRARTRPLFVSIGHRISLTTAIGYVLACAPRYRLPETTRAAHRLASEEKAGEGGMGGAQRNPSRRG